jgi:tetrahydromethanopterin S-methyltransferase subunit G
VASLAKLAEKLKQEKQKTSKLRRLTENKLKKTMSIGRKSSSGLMSVQKRLENTKEKMGEINAEFNHILARKESIERLIKVAQERLNSEMEAKGQAEIDLANAESDDAKRALAERLSQIDEKIADLESEIKQREASAQELVKTIESFKKTKTQTSKQIKKHVTVKPTLVTLIKQSKVDSEKLKKQFESLLKKEDAASKKLAKVTQRLEQIMATKRKAAAKKAALQRMKRIKLQKKKTTLKKKAAVKKKAKIRTKRKTSKKTAASKKTAKKSAKSQRR